MRPGAAIACLVLFLAGCVAGPAPRPAGPGVPGPAPDAGTSADSARADGSGDRTARTGAPSGPSGTSGATLALLARSREQRFAGDLAAAAATVERALGIAPDDPLLWVELAEIRMDQGNPGLAEEMARKALTLTADNSPLATRARLLITR